jgi:crotonobetainyl-CoA:carnitine CoA-transferase CaiB-like acyl-CoA transferase
MVESDNYWPEFCRAIGRSELIDDARFLDAAARFRNSGALVGILDRAFREHTLAEWEERLSRHRLIWSPMRTLAEAIEDPQAHAGGVFSTVSHPTAGSFESVAPPLKLSAHPMHETRPAPELGADGEQILREAGLAPEEIKAALEP